MDTPSLSDEKKQLLEKNRQSLGRNHEYLRDFATNEVALSFFDLKPGTLWTPFMGKVLVPFLNFALIALFFFQFVYIGYCCHLLLS